MASKSFNNLIDCIIEKPLTLGLEFLVTVFHQMYNGGIFT